MSKGPVSRRWRTVALLASHALVRYAMVVALALAFCGPAVASVTIGEHGALLLEGEPTFVVGLADPPPLGGLTPTGTDGWDEVTSAGVHMVRYILPRGARWSPDYYDHAQATLDAAAARGAVVRLYLHELSQAQPGTPEDATLRELVARFSDHPGLGFWLGRDEPWLSRILAPTLAHTYATLKELDPSTPVYMVQGARGRAEHLAPYASVTDVHGADPFPIGYGVARPDLQLVPRTTRKMLRITPNQAVVMTLPVCGSGSVGPKGYVLPSHRQTRYMTYAAIQAGARGVNYYGGHAACLNARDVPLRWNWTHWYSVLRPVVAELSGDLHAALVAHGTGLGVRGARGFAVTSRRTATDVWVIVTRHGKARRSRKAVQVTGLPADLVAGEPYGQGAPVAVRGGAFTLTMRRWDVRVVRFRL